MGVDIGHRSHACFRVNRTCPLRNVAGHIEESVRIRAVRTHAARNQVAVLRVVALVGLEVGIEASFAVFLYVLFLIGLPRERITLFTTRSIFPLYLCREAIALNEARLSAQAFHKILRTPSTESIGLLPTDAHDRIIVIDVRSKVKARIQFVVGVRKVVNPARRVRIYIYYICI